MKSVRSFHGPCGLLAALFLLVSPWMAAAGEPTGALAKFAESRNWVDQTGKFQIGGSLKSADKTNVEILKTDGLVIKVPLDKLSAKDQEFIQQFLKAESEQSDPANPFAGGVAANPFAGGRPAGAMPAANPPAAGPGAFTPGDIPKVNATAAGARPINLSPGRAFWSVKPPIALPKLNLRDAIYPIAIDKQFFAKMAVGVGGRAPTVIVNVYQEGRKPEEKYGHFVPINAADGQTPNVTKFNEPWRLTAVSPNGKMIAAVRIEGFDKGNDLAILKIEGDQIIPVLQFTAGGGSWDEVRSVEFLPNNRIAVINQKRKLTIWELQGETGVKAIYQGELPGSLDAKFSAAGELMVFFNGKNIGLIETGSFSMVGSIEVDGDVTQVALSSDGKKLAATTWDSLFVYSMDDGSLQKTIPTGNNGNSNLTWAGDYAKVGDLLYDVNLGIPFWTYSNRGNASVMYDDFVFSCFGDKNMSTLTINQIPHEAAIRSVGGFDPKTIYAMSPGSEVRVNMDLASLPADQQKTVQAAVDEKITETGWKRNDAAQVTLDVKVEQGEEKEEEYVTQKSRGFGPPLPIRPFGPRPSGPTEKVKFRPWTHSFVLKMGDKVLFQSQRVVSAPSNFITKEDESLQEAVLSRIKPDPNWFKSIRVPSYLIRPENKSGLGSSSITKAGLN